MCECDVDVDGWVRGKCVSLISQYTPRLDIYTNTPTLLQFHTFFFFYNNVCSV